MPVLARALFPGSHCLNVILDQRVLMHKHHFLALSGASVSAFEIWMRGGGHVPTSAIEEETHRQFKANPSCQEALNLSIPRIDGLASLPETALLVFSNGKEESSAILSSDCRIMFFRKGVATDADSIASFIHQHIREDLAPMLRTAEKLFVNDMSKPITRRSLALLIEFYLTTDPAQMAPVIRQRVFTLDDAKPSFIGRICAACTQISDNMKRCPCSTGVYYCCRACQRSDLPMHKAICDAAKGKNC